MRSLRAGSPARAAFAFIFVTALLDMLGLGIVAPVFPQLTVQLQGGDAAGGAAAFGIFTAVWALMQFIFSPVLGALSDRYGRRPVILISTLGTALDYVVMALAPNLTVLFAGRIISGITASNLATAGAYIADVTPPEQRAARFGKLGVAFGIGFIMGPAVGGLLGGFNLRAPFWFAAALSFANFLYGAFVLPESLPPEKRSEFKLKTANPLGAVAFLRSRAGLLGLAAVGFLAYVAHDVLPNTFVLYTNYRYHWDARTIGLVLMLVGAASIVVQGFVVGRAVAALGEARALAAGLLVGTAGLVVFALAPAGPVYLVGVPLWALFGLTNPSLMALLSRRVKETEQGRLQGSMSSLRAVATMIAPLLFTGVFALAISRLRELQVPGAAFLLAAVLLLGAFALSNTLRPSPRLAGSN